MAIESCDVETEVVATLFEHDGGDEHWGLRVLELLVRSGSRTRRQVALVRRTRSGASFSIRIPGFLVGPVRDALSSYLEKQS